MVVLLLPFRLRRQVGRSTTLLVRCRRLPTRHGGSDVGIASLVTKTTVYWLKVDLTAWVTADRAMIWCHGLCSTVDRPYNRSKSSFHTSKASGAVHPSSCLRIALFVAVAIELVADEKERRRICAQEMAVLV